MKLTKKIKREVDRILVQMPWNRNAHAVEMHIGADELHKIGALPYAREKKEKFLRIHIPIDIMVMTRGIPFTAERNPFVATLAEGAKPLEEHYARFQPKNLAQMYQLEETGREGVSSCAPSRRAGRMPAFEQYGANQ